MSANPNRTDTRTPRVAVVTGAAAGIGRAIAGAFAADGDHVVLVDIDADTGDQARRSLAADGLSVAFAACDVTNEGAVRTLFDSLEEQHGGLDVLVNNAGGGPRSPFRSMSLGAWRGSIELNLTSVFLCTQGALPLLERRPGASVINLASLHAFKTVPGMAAYAAAKGGVVGLTQSLALELAPTVRVNAIAPGLIETEGWRASVGDVAAARAARLPHHPLARLGVPDDVAACARFLRSDAASFLTGVTVPVAGGLGLQLYP